MKTGMAFLAAAAVTLAVMAAGASAGMATVPMYGNIAPDGIFWFNASVGTPGVSFPVVLDTGSSDFIIPLAGCGGCAVKATEFHPKKSSTAQPVPCDGGCPGGCVNGQCYFYNSYETCNLQHPDQPCSVTGPLYQDNVHVGGLKSSMTFGTIANQTKDFEQFQIVDGVAGVSGTSGSWGEATLNAALLSSGAIDHDIFAFCFNKGKYSGAVTFGGIDSRLHSSPIQYTPLSDFFGYQLGVDHIEVDGSSIGLPSTTSSILDSGTNTFLLPTADFQAIQSKFQGDCSSKKLHGVCDVPSGSTLFDGKCFKFTEAEIAMFPEVSVVLQGNVKLTFGADKYLVPPTLGSGINPDMLCLGMQANSQLFIIGDVPLSNYYTVVDLDNSQVGFGDVNKDNCGNLDH